MAFLAFRLGVRSIQLEARRRVIEIPGFPRSGVMANLALPAVATFVFIVFLVAAVARQRRVLEGRRQVALLAFDLSVAGRQGETRFVVVERNILPLALVVATVALLS